MIGAHPSKKERSSLALWGRFAHLLSQYPRINLGQRIGPRPETDRESVEFPPLLLREALLHQGEKPLPVYRRCGAFVLVLRPRQAEFLPDVLRFAGLLLLCVCVSHAVHAARNAGANQLADDESAPLPCGVARRGTHFPTPSYPRREEIQRPHTGRDRSRQASRPGGVSPMPRQNRAGER